MKNSMNYLYKIIFVLMLFFPGIYAQSEGQILAPLTKREIIDGWLNQTRRFEITKADPREAFGYVELTLVEYLNRLAEAGKIKNKEISHFAIQMSDFEGETTCEGESIKIRDAIESMCGSLKAVIVIDDVGIAVIPERIKIDKNNYDSLGRFIFFKKNEK